MYKHNNVHTNTHMCMHTCRNTCTHNSACIHPTHVYICTQMHEDKTPTHNSQTRNWITHTDAHRPMHTQRHVQTHMHTHMQPHMYTQFNLHANPRRVTYTDTCTNTKIRVQIHIHVYLYTLAAITRIHIHAQIDICEYILWWPFPNLNTEGHNRYV